MSVIFDTLEYVKGAKNVGFTEDQAEYQAKKMANLIDDSLATKHDLTMLEQRLMIKLGGLIIAGITLLGFILKH